MSGKNGSPGSLSTSRSLLVRLRAEDSEAWDRLVELYAPLVLYWCRRWNLQSSDVADIFQEVFQAVAVHIGKFRKQQASDTFRGWLRVLTRNKVYDHFRRQKRQPMGAGGTEAQKHLAQIPAPEPTAADPTDAQANLGLMQRALDQLRENFQEHTWRAFWRTVIDGQAPKDIAQELSMTPGAVRVAKYRVLQRLREELGDLIE